MTAFMLDAMLESAAFQSELVVITINLSSMLMAEHSMLYSRVQFRIVDDSICYELRVISIPIGTFIKGYS